MTGTARLRAGLVGLGAMGRNHARVLASLDGVDLIGIADPKGDARDVGQGIALFEQVDALVERGLDYCVVAAPTALHDAIGAQLAAAGIPMLVEKPVAADVASAVRLVDTFEKADLVAGVGHIERYNPALRQLKARLEAGELGEIFQVATRRQGPFPSRIADVGVVMDLATHDIDLTSFVTGAQFTAISARTAHKSGREHEDLVAATARLSDETVTNHLVNWLSPLKERLTVVTGERGTFVANTLTAELTFYANGTVLVDWPDIAHFRGMTEGDVIRYAFAKPEPLRTEHEAFRDAVLGISSDIVSLRQGLQAVNVADAVLASARSGRTIELQHGQN